MPALPIGALVRVRSPWGDNQSVHKITGALGIDADGQTIPSFYLYAVGWQYQIDGSEAYLAVIYVEEVT